MTVRVYILAAASREPLVPTFRHIPGGRMKAAVEVMDLADFMRLSGERLAAMGVDLAAALGRRHEASPYLPAASDPDAGGPAFYREPEQNFYDPEEVE